MDSLRKMAFAAVIVAVAVASLPAVADTGTRRAEEPGAGAMVADLLVARPIGVVITAVGTATFLVGLPFIMAGGNVAESGEKLVVRPAQETFNRCLGCTNAGWRGDYPEDRRP